MKMLKMKYSLTFALSILLITGCTKTNNNNTPIYTDDDKEFTYEIKGLADMSLERTGEDDLLLNILRLTGKTEEVSMSIVDAPDGLTAIFDPSSTGEPSFNVTFKLVSKKVKEGTYTVKLKVATPTTGISEFPFKLTVLPYSNPASALVGEFDEKGSCTQSGALDHNAKIEIAQDSVGKVNIKGFWKGVWSNIVYGYLDPTNNTITIPAQVQNNATFQGSGTYDDTKVIVNYTVNNSVVSDTCTSTFTLKP